jgi:glycosyltransferase involved in cell wall biosynthesis
VANVSWAGDRFTRAERDMIADASDVLFVASAGNGAESNDGKAEYPCSHDLANVICVAASDRADALADFSNFGTRTSLLCYSPARRPAPGRRARGRHPVLRRPEGRGAERPRDRRGAGRGALRPRAPVLAHRRLRGAADRRRGAGGDGHEGDRRVLRRLRPRAHAVARVDAVLRSLGIAEERIGRWDRGVDVDLFDPARRDPAMFERDGRVTVLYAGRQTKEKGADPLADAFLRARERDPRLHLALAGGGPEQESLRARLGGHATFLGWLEAEQLAAAYGSADVFPFASRTDTFGQVLLEAQASGLPVVAVAEGGPCSIVRSGVTGLAAGYRAALVTRSASTESRRAA